MQQHDILQLQIGKRADLHEILLTDKIVMQTKFFLDNLS